MSIPATPPELRRHPGHGARRGPRPARWTLTTPKDRRTPMALPWPHSTPTLPRPVPSVPRPAPTPPSERTERLDRIDGTDRSSARTGLADRAVALARRHPRLAQLGVLATNPLTALVVMLVGLALLFVLPLVGLPFVAVVVLPAVVYHLRPERRTALRRPLR